METWKPVPRGAIQQGSEHLANSIKSGLVPEDGGVHIGYIVCVKDGIVGGLIHKEFDAIEHFEAEIAV